MQSEYLTVRDINRILLQGAPVVAQYLLQGTEHYGRIIRARKQHGTVQGKLLGSGRWVAVFQVQEAR